MKRNLVPAACLAAMLICAGSAQAQSFDQNTYYRLRNLATGHYLNQEPPQLATGPIQPGWWSGQWALERVDDGQTYWRIRNRWRGTFVRQEGSRLEAAFAAPGWWDAMWTLELREAGYVITNRNTGQTLETINGNPAAPEKKPERPTIYWSIEQDSKPIVEVAKGYFLTVAHSLKCVDLRDGLLTTGTPIVQNECDPARVTQTWIERTLEAPWALYVSSPAGKCMEVSGDPNAAGSNIVLADCDAKKTTQWFRAHNDSQPEKGQILGKTGFCLDVGGWSQSSGAQILQWHCARQANQTFTRQQTPVTVLSAVTKSVLDTVTQDVIGIEDADPDICWKNTSTRGVGKIPTTCPAGYPDYDGALVCYQSCQPGYTGVSWVCWQKCPAGFTDIGVSCAKPAPYGRGGGYAYWWPFEGRADAVARCERNTGQACEIYGELAYPKCAAGYYAFGCCICSPLCPSGMRDDGAFCAKNTYTRGSASTACPAGQAYDAGLCYPQCPSGSSGVGPVCWGSCSGKFPTGCGASCAKSVSACTFSIINQVESTASIALNVASLVLTAGAATPAINLARQAAKNAGKRTLSAIARKEMKDRAEETIRKALTARRNLGKIEKIQGKLDDAAQVSDNAELMVKAYEDGEFDWTILVPTTLADFDPTGILSVVQAFNKPICK